MDLAFQSSKTEPQMEANLCEPGALIYFARLSFAARAKESAWKPSALQA
jgi:hypothetical protein